MKAGVSARCYNDALDELVSQIVAARSYSPRGRALLAGVSGIDASGKGFVSARLAETLRKTSMNVALICADDWLNVPDVCLPHPVLKSGAGMSPTPKALRAKHFASALGVRRVFSSLSYPLPVHRNGSAEHFYENALRLDEMFKRLILPLRNKRSVDVIADCGDAKATVHRRHRYHFRNIDVILLEGILLFKRAYRDHFDLKIWIECSFETALQRAIARGQEGLPPAETARAFETIYFPAQRLHFGRDEPRECADVIFCNDGGRRAVVK